VSRRWIAHLEEHADKGMWENHRNQRRRVVYDRRYDYEPATPGLPVTRSHVRYAKTKIWTVVLTRNLVPYPQESTHSTLVKMMRRS
jgi:hypothetical protein